ncbi:MAG: FtsW/RodA/SpoVE family cell cycle protein [bacterium]
MRIWRLQFQPRDWAILVLLGVILCVSVAFVHSASWRSGPMGEGHYTSSPLKQVQWIVLGSFLFVGVLSVNYRHLLEHVYLLYVIGVGLLVYVLFFGVQSSVIHAKRWIQVGPFRVQPSEFMKILMILVLARYLMYQDSHREFGGLVVPFALVAVPMLLIAREPDLGTALVFLPIVFAMLFVAASRVKHLVIIVALFMALVPAVWAYMQPYQRERVIAHLSQDDPKRREPYQLRQAKAAIGSGGWAGKGLGQGTHQRYNFIPPKTRNNDFIFAVICEEWGFLGANLVFALYLALLWLCIRNADATKHPGGRLIIVGVVAMVGTQVVVNTAMATGQLPIVGLPLPLISYGGSSMLSSLFGLALVLNVSAYRRIDLGRDDFEADAAGREGGPMPEESFMRPS